MTSNDQRERKLLTGTTFKVRPCGGLFPSQRLIDAAKGNRQDVPTGGNDGNREVAAYLPHLSLATVGIADMLAEA